ncbi:MAG: hypothetical protein J7M34_00580 [Anaerolineae bacterium]|nr:hypothetical protein [Anaerolineae bacterium]
MNDELPRLACLLAPQRSTQYADLVTRLALPELQISPLGPLITRAEHREIGGGSFLVLSLREVPNEERLIMSLGRLAMTRGAFWLKETVGEEPGPWLRPIAILPPTGLPATLLYARRYRGKTNEEITRLLINAAHFASDFAQTAGPLDILDPLCGGGTTLFAALVAGHNAYGIDRARNDVTSTASFLRNFLTEAGIRYTLREERLRGLGHRWTFAIEGPTGPLTCILAHGETTDAATLLPGVRPHLIVGDLPYGIQHKGAVLELLQAALPEWVTLLRRGGALALAWDATRLPRPTIVEVVQTAAPSLTVLDEPPWSQMAHPVDRVIKRRDILIARRGQALEG